MSSRRDLHKIAVIGNHTPRRCGIATFTADLTDALVGALPRTDIFVVAMNEAGHRHDYPARVTHEIAEGELLTAGLTSYAIAKLRS